MKFDWFDWACGLLTTNFGSRHQQQPSPPSNYANKLRLPWFPCHQSPPDQNFTMHFLGAHFFLFFIHFFCLNFHVTNPPDQNFTIYFLGHFCLQTCCRGFNYLDGEVFVLLWEGLPPTMLQSNSLPETFPRKTCLPVESVRPRQMLPTFYFPIWTNTFRIMDKYI